MTNFHNNVTAPENMQELIVQTNSYTGLVSPGILIIIWMVVFGSIHRRGYRVGDAMHAANFTATSISMVLFAFQLIGGRIPILMFAITSGMLAWKSMSARR
jgi:hypothetical protein